MAHVPGQLDFCIEEKEFPITLFRRKPSEIWAYVETPGHVVILTRRGKRVCELLSIETHACLSCRYDEEMAEVAKLDRGVRYYHRTDEQLVQFAGWRPAFEEK